MFAVPSQSISLRTQLLCTIVGSIVATAVALTTLAYRAQIGNLEIDARRAARVAAESRAEAVLRMIDGQQQRAQRFLITAASLCGEETGSGIAWELGCARRALRELRASEHATGALLTSRRRRIARTGVALPDRLPIPTPLARLIERDGEMTYVILAQDRGASVRLQFGLRDLSPLLDQALVGGASGELFLRGSTGGFLTSPRFGSAAAQPPPAEPSLSCASGPAEWSGIDYRGVDTIHAVHSVPAFGEPVCVDAHISHQEALAPAGVLLVALLTPGALFAAMGGVLALVAAHWMTAPVQRLAASARALHGGDFARPIPTGGPTEIRALARALDGMARALGEQITGAQRARHDAETANHAKDEFLAVLSHELSTPLTSTLGWLRLLRGGRLEAAKADQAIVAIERSAQKQKRLVEDLLDVSRIVAGRLHLDLAMVELTDPVRAAVEELRLIAGEKGVALESVFEATPIVSADPFRIQQIVTNLVTNAIKFTSAGGRVTIRVRAVDECAELGVFDTGVGIPAEFLPRVFEPFQQADRGPQRAYGGLGLGLSIVHHLVRLHGGVIQATSMGPGCGASFVVRLPLAPILLDKADQRTQPALRDVNMTHECAGI